MDERLNIKVDILEYPAGRNNSTDFNLVESMGYKKAFVTELGYLTSKQNNLICPKQKFT